MWHLILRTILPKEKKNPKQNKNKNHTTVTHPEKNRKSINETHGCEESTSLAHAGLFSSHFWLSVLSNFSLISILAMCRRESHEEGQLQDRSLREVKASSSVALTWGQFRRGMRRERGTFRRRGKWPVSPQTYLCPCVVTLSLTSVPSELMCLTSHA